METMKSPQTVKIQPKVWKNMASPSASSEPSKSKGTKGVAGLMEEVTSKFIYQAFASVAS